MSRRRGAICAIVVICATSAFAAARPLGPSSQCGWPAVYHGGLFGPSTVLTGQYLLSHALNATVPPTGVFDNATSAAVKRFQAMTGLPVNGYLDHLVWPVLTATAGDISLGAFDSRAVRALQVALTSNGFPVAVSGNYSSETLAQLIKFQHSRHDRSDLAPITNVTWHLLVTGCNSSGAFWFDAGWPQGNMTTEMLHCLRHEYSFEFALFECWVEVGPGTFWEECVGNIARAKAAGFDKVGVYMFAQRYADPEPQVRQLLANLSAHEVNYSMVMLDIEGDKWGQYTQAENRDFILALRRAFEAANVTIAVYCGREWPDFFGNTFDSFADLPLIYAHYDNVPSFYDFNPYGGWNQPAGKQFWDGSEGEQVCGTGMLDWDWSSSRFWL